MADDYDQFTQRMTSFDLTLGPELPVDEVGDDLAHHGVKGMKWGVRKPRDEEARAAKFGGKKSEKKITRKENRQLNREAADKFYEEKVNSMIKEAGGKKVILVKAYTGEAYPTLMEGKEFVRHLQNGGVLDIKRSDIYARQLDDTGPLVTTEQRSRTYKKQNFRS